MSDDGQLSKRQFLAKHGFWPHQELCVCGWRRADHSVWNTDPRFKAACSKDGFRSTGKKS